MSASVALHEQQTIEVLVVRVAAHSRGTYPEQQSNHSDVGKLLPVDDAGVGELVLRPVVPRSDSTNSMVLVYCLVEGLSEQNRQQPRRAAYAVGADGY